MSIIEKIKSFFSKKDNEKQEKEEALKELVSLRNSMYFNLKKWDEIPIFNCKTKNKKRLLIMDDYDAVTKIIREDLDTIFYRKYDAALSKSTIELIDSLTLTRDEIEICEVSTGIAPYIVYKSCLEELDNCCFDFAILDIIFGDYVLKEDKKFYLDGIDIAKFLLDKNPNIKEVFFTGCFMDSTFNSEKDKIINRLGEDYYKNNIIEKTDSKDERIAALLTKVFYEYLN